MSELNQRDDASRYGLGLLFTDGMPELDEHSGYRGAVAARAAGISYRQLDYWARTELVQPTVRGAAGSGSQRLYGFRDILVLKLVKRLLDCANPGLGSLFGCSLQRTQCVELVLQRDV